jgi:hypothetical protein
LRGKSLTMKFFVLLFLTVSCTYAQQKDYRIYHTQINKAEELFFCEQKTDSALYYYDKTFAEYDFIFLKDIVNAMQIAKFTKKDYKKYLHLGFKFGLKVEHLNLYLLFKDDYLKLLSDKKPHQVYLTNRKIYLEKIDYKYLDWIYKIGLKDQVDKNGKDYERVIQKTVASLKDSISKKGFPGERLIGIADSTVFRDAGRWQLDQRFRVINKRRWLETDDDIFSQNWPFIIMYHYRCTYYELKDLLKKEMIKGNIHPRDIGTIYDASKKCGKENLKGAYRLDPFTSESAYGTINNKLINQMREELYIVPLEVDNIKKAYEKWYNFRLFTGFMNNR